MDAFSKILEKNIEGDINCLREKLNMFISTVETDRPGYASKEVLKDTEEKNEANEANGTPLDNNKEDQA